MGKKRKKQIDVELTWKSVRKNYSFTIFPTTKMKDDFKKNANKQVMKLFDLISLKELKIEGTSNDDLRRVFEFNDKIDYVQKRITIEEEPERSNIVKDNMKCPIVEELDWKSVMNNCCFTIFPTTIMKEEFKNDPNKQDMIIFDIIFKSKEEAMKGTPMPGKSRREFEFNNENDYIQNEIFGEEEPEKIKIEEDNLNYSIITKEFKRKYFDTVVRNVTSPFSMIVKRTKDTLLNIYNDGMQVEFEEYLKTENPVVSSIITIDNKDYIKLVLLIGLVK